MVLRICVVLLCLCSVPSWGHLDRKNDTATTQGNNIAESSLFIIPSRTTTKAKPCSCMCPGRTVKPPTISSTTAAPPTSAKPCGGWLGPACPPENVTSPASSTPKPCGGWLQPACPKPTTASPPSSTSTSPPTTQSPCAGSNAAIRAAIDFFLKQVRRSFKAGASQVISLPNLYLSLEIGSLVATGGYLKGFQSIYLAGGITVATRGLGYIIDFPVALKEMEIGYYNYSIAILNAGPRGGIKVGVENNRFNIRLSMSVGQPCLVVPVEVKTTRLSGLTADMTHGCCQKVVDMATVVIEKRLPTIMKFQLQTEIANFLTTALPGKGFVCEKYIDNSSVNVNS